MSEYYFVKENQPTPIYETPEEYEDALYSTIFTFPKEPVPVLAKYKPKVDYLVGDIVIQPEFSISRDIYGSLSFKSIYGGNWVPIKIIDNGEYNLMSLQLANEVDAIDHDKSRYKRYKRGRISGMKNIILDKRKLSQIPLERRLIFRDSCWGFYLFFHKTIVDEILSFNPTGVEFVPVEEFDESWAG
ncbi:hypothetical protein ACPV5O_25925 [Vibrio maritimus]|uniref:hypothetical protein n=1 Tax=Vibrio maritimus TaxID=990268 RepID=UPI0040694BD0